MNNLVKSAIYGFAIGDALGVPYEFKERDTFKCKDMVGHGTWDQPVGTWSDDTSMVLATMAAFRPNYLITLDSIMRNFSKWYHEGKFTPHGNCFDIGETTKSAINNYDSGIKPNECGLTSEYSNGNGGLMRILPLAFFEYNEKFIDDVCALTHNTTRSKFACEIYVKICRSIMDNKFNLFDPYLDMINNMDRRNVKSTGYVLDSLVAALWSFLTTNNYEECVLTAVNLGGDTDTIAALAGGLAGLYYEFDNIPKKWVDQLANKDLIDSIIDEF